jgi:hypothetical protein
MKTLISYLRNQQGVETLEWILIGGLITGVGDCPLPWRPPSRSYWRNRYDYNRDHWRDALSQRYRGSYGAPIRYFSK